MKTVLVYSDSLTWGIIPGTRDRLPFGMRWPGVTQQHLTDQGHDVRVVEDCLNGRRTTFDAPYKPGRNGLRGIRQVIEAQSPLRLVILMLGTNDFQSMHPHNAWHSAQGINALIGAVRSAPIEPGMPIPPLLVVAPPAIDNPRGPIGPKFTDGDTKSVGLAEEFRQVCVTDQCAFFDANTVKSTSRVDGVNLDSDQHATLGAAIAHEVAPLIR